jgi:hypothetical protein
LSAAVSGTRLMGQMILKVRSSCGGERGSATASMCAMRQTRASVTGE